MSSLFRRPSTKVPSRPRPHLAARPSDLDAGHDHDHDHDHDDGDYQHRASAPLQFYDDNDPASAYSSLLSDDHEPSSDTEAAAPTPVPRHRRAKSSPMPAAWANPEFTASRPWLSTAEGRPSWVGERPPARKLVKEPNGSARPSMSIELSESDGEKDKGLVKRGFERLRGLYRREK